MNGKRGRALVRATVLAIGITAAGAPRESAASGSGGSGAMTYFFGAILIGAPVVLNETLALMSGVANGVSASRGVRPTKGWLALGYATNSISVIGGAAMMVAGFLSKGSVQTGYDKSGYPVYGYDYKTDGTLVGIGSALFAIGGMGLGFTIWGHSKPKNPGLNLTVKPIAGFGARGEFFAGASLELAGF